MRKPVQTYEIKLQWLLDAMRAQSAQGASRESVAMSRRDFAMKTRAIHNHEQEAFEQAWQNMLGHLEPILRTARSGNVDDRLTTKYMPKVLADYENYCYGPS